MTPEQLAQQYAKDNWINLTTIGNDEIVRIFLAGYSAAHQWVDVKEMLPEIQKDVMVPISEFGDPTIRTGYMDDDGRWFLISGAQVFPTHWLPLPPFPTTK